MRQTHQAWQRSAAFLLVLGAALAGALPAVAGSVSFSIDMNGSYLAVPTADGGVQLQMQPFNGIMQPFGQCRAELAGSGSPTPLVFTLANGMTITMSTAFLYGDSPAAPVAVSGTITGGSGIFEGASGAITGTITANTAAATASTLPLTLTASGTLTAPKAPSGLNVLPGVLTFSIPNGSTAPMTQNLIVNNEGLDAASYQVAVATVSGGNWLTASPGSGSVAGASSSTIAVTANPASGGAGLEPGIYDGQVTVTYGSVQVAIKAQLIVGGLGANLLVSQTGLTFQAGAGGAPSHALTFQVENTGTGSLAQLKATTSVTGGGVNWLNVTITPVPGNPQASTVTVTVNPVPAVAGTYYGRIDLTLSNAANSPQSVSVVLQDMAGPLPDISPDGFVMTTSYLFGAPGIPVEPQAIQLTNLSTHTVTFTVTGGSGPSGASPTSAAMDWLTFSPASGVMGPGGVASVTVSVPAACFGTGDPCQLWFNNYGEISFHFVEDNYTAGINIGLDIPDLYGAIGLTGAVRPGPKAVTTCVPSQVGGVFTSLPIGFQVTVGLPVPIEVKILDSCGQTMDTGTAVATFSSGDPPLTLTSIGGGQWTGTWTPRTAAAQTTVTVDAAETGASTGALQVSGSVAASTSTPIVNVGGIVNAASGALTIAPGAFIEIYGLNLGGAVNVAPPTAYPTLLGGTQVLLGGQPMPLYFTSNQQIDAIVPYDIVPNSQQQVIVQTGMAYSEPEPVTVGVAEPGVFTQDQTGTGAGAIFGQKPGGVPTLNTPANPASAGDALWIYCTGLGTVSPAVAAGVAASTSTLSYTDAKVTVTVGGIDAQGLFAGLAPELVGLYQVNVIVPPGVAPGPNVPVIVNAAGAASPPVTVAIQ